MCPVVEVAAREGAAGAQPIDGALVTDPPTIAPGAGTEIDDMVGDGDQFWFVLHHQHRVSLVT